MYLKCSIGCIPFLVVALLGVANSGSGQEEKIDRGSMTGTGYSILAGFDIGGVMSISGDAEDELDKNGYLYGAKGLFSLYTRQMAFDIGAGIIYNKVKGEAKQNASAEIQDKNEIAFTSGTAEVSARYHMGNGLELGPTILATYGEDSSLSPDIDAPDDNQAFFGIELLMTHLVGSQSDFRYGVRFLTDLTVKDRQIHYLSFGIRYGLPLVKPDVIVKTRTKVETRTKIQTKYKTKIKTEVKEVEKVVYKPVYVFKTDSINFEFSKAILLPQSKQFLGEVGRYLAQNDMLWERIEIAGHTDSVGGMAFNMKLSRERAEAVRSELVANGVNAGKVTARGFGPTQPLVQGDDDVARAKNRRVDINFSGRTDFNRLGRGLEEIRKRYRSPDTCSGTDCR